MAFTFGPKNNLTKAALKIVDELGNEISPYVDSTIYEFYLNPSSWKESKKSNWIKQQIPGLSDPHQQWVSSGPRTITFDALVTKDISEIFNNNENEQIKQLSTSQSVIKKVGGIAQQLLNIPGLSSLEILNNSNNTRSGNTLNLDINFKLNYYRSLLYPKSFDKRANVTKSPFLVRLIVGKTFGIKTAQTGLFVVDNIDISITKQLPDLTPIEAIVTFTLTEFVSENKSFDSIY